MNEVEQRELSEQQRKIFEAGVQRTDKRSGSFSFLTWPFFIAPLIACEAFLAAMFRSAAAEEEEAKTAQAGAALQAANDHPPTSDLSRTGAEDETAKGPTASLEAHAAQLNPTGLLAQPHEEDAPEPSTARDEAVADASAAGGGGDDAGSRHHGAHTSIDDSSVNSLSADCHFGSGPFPGASTLVVDSLSPALSNDAAGAIAPVEAAARPVLATVTGTVGTLDDAAGAIAPVEAAVQPVLATVTGTVGTLDDAAGAIAPVEAAARPVLATVTGTVGTLDDAAGAIAPVEAAARPVLATVTETVGTLDDDVAGVIAPVEVPDISTGQAPGPADILLALATETDARIEVPGSATAASANVVTGVSNAAAAVDPTAIEGDVIELNDAPPPPANALFTGTKYTDYGVTLSSGTAAPPQHAVSPTNAASAQETLVPEVVDVQQHAPTAPEIVDTTPPIDHLGLREAVL
jgi:hypothetical protein